MTRETLQAIEVHGAAVDLSARAKFRLSGADRVRYLNGQVTNDVRKATATSAVYACITNAKGRIEADVFIHATPDGYLLVDAEAALRDTLAARLDRYIVADDVTLEDVTDAWCLWHVFGPLQDAFQKWWAGNEAVFSPVKCKRFGIAGLDFWAPNLNSLGALPSTLLSPADAETLRIVRGLPRWPSELTVDTFPQEAGIEATAMDFSKGCYIGQEVLSRIKMSGKMPRRLVRFSVVGFPREDATSFADQARLKFCTGNVGAPTEVGEVTSIAWHPVLDRVVGLGYVRHSVYDSDSLLLASADLTRIFANVEFSLL
ncbi:MAG: YgfZ/GcvT domain-containing protein [Roseimicrobium sp.]